MNAFVKCVAAVAALVFAFVSPVRAGGVSDMWWNAGESGWGVNVVGQGSTLFLTFYVYGQNGQPLWLVAPATKYQSEGAGGRVYSGPLYQTSGPWLGGPFNPSAVNVTQVGTTTFTHVTTTTATIAYTVNGTPVNKSLVRFTWENNSYLPGTYLGAIVLDRTGCSGVSRYEALAQFTVSITGSTMQVSLQPSSGGSCSASGPYVQEGSQARFAGSGTSCAGAGSGTASFTAIDANALGIAGRIEASYPGGCREDGTFGGVWKAD